MSRYADEWWWGKPEVHPIHKKLVVDNEEYRECLMNIAHIRLSVSTNKAAAEKITNTPEEYPLVYKAAKIVQEQAAEDGKPLVVKLRPNVIIAALISILGQQGLETTQLPEGQSFWKILEQRLRPVDSEGRQIRVGGDRSAPIQYSTPGNPARMMVMVDEESGKGKGEMAGEQKIDILPYHLTLLANDSLYYQSVSVIMNVRKSVKTDEEAIKQLISEYKINSDPNNPVWTTVRIIRGKAKGVGITRGVIKDKRRYYKGDTAVLAASFETIVTELVHILSQHGIESDNVSDEGSTIKESEKVEVEDMATPPPDDNEEEPVEDMSNLLAKAMHAAGGIIALQDALGLPRGAIRSWNGKIPPEHLLAVKRITGLPSSDFIDEINNDPDNEDDEQEDDEQMELDEPQYIKPVTKPPSIVDAINDICDRRDDKIREQARHLGMMTFEDMLTFIEQEAKINGITPHTVLNLAIRIKNRLK